MPTSIDENIVGDSRTPGEQHALFDPIEPDRLGMDEPRPGESGQAHEIDMRFIRRIDAGDDAGQHAGIGRFQVAGHQRHPHPRQRPCREGLEHMHMGMAAADEHDIGGDGDVAVHVRVLSGGQGGPAAAGRRRVS